MIFPLLLSATNTSCNNLDTIYSFVNDVLNRIITSNNLNVTDNDSNAKTIAINDIERSVVFDNKKHVTQIIEPKSNDYEIINYSSNGQIESLSSRPVNILKKEINDNVYTELNGITISSYNQSTGIKQFRNGFKYSVNFQSDCKDINPS